MLKVKVEGLDKMQREMRSLAQRARALEGTRSVSLGELFPDTFMHKNTSFTSIDAMFSASGFKIESNDDLERIPDTDWDAFVAARTRFSSWEEMLGAAGEAYITQKLGF